MAVRLFRLFWLTVLVGHAILAILWWALAAWRVRRGPSTVLVQHGRADRGSGTFDRLALALHRESNGLLQYLLPLWPAAWVAAALTARILFPVSLAWPCLIPAAAAVVMAFCTIPAYRKGGDVRAPRAFGTAGLAAIAGVAIACTQNPPRAATHPLNVPFPAPDPDLFALGRSGGGDSPGQPRADSDV